MKIRQQRIQDYQCTKIDSLDDFEIIHSYLLVDILNDPIEEITPAGIIKVGDTEFEEAEHAPRMGRVVKKCKRMFMDPRPEHFSESADWLAEVEVEEGDLVWFSYFEGLKGVNVIYEGKQYKMIRYEDCYVAKRKFKTIDELFDSGLSFDDSNVLHEGEGVSLIVPLNGYCIFEEVSEKRRSKLEVIDHIDTNYGICRYIGKPVIKYKWMKPRGTKKLYAEREPTDSGVDIKSGDKVFFENKKIHIVLEPHLHKNFDNTGKVYFVEQRRRCSAVVVEENFKKDLDDYLEEESFVSQIPNKKSILKK